mmetsp:Transcript_13843/g.48238  ORF Transcript_13843/g.48238 Transcript_13843/m.48238 type:complete len:213 (-) Transcript_13843:3324-3962(-)
MISLSRGTPSVTFLADTPAKWNVLSVICVSCSPTDCAATMPHTSPPGASERWKRAATSATIHSNAALVSWNSVMTRLEASVERRRMAKAMVALCCASSASAPSPEITGRSCAMSFWMLSMTSRGCRSLGSAVERGCLDWPVLMRRIRFTGSGSVPVFTLPPPRSATLRISYSSSRSSCSCCSSRMSSTRTSSSWRMSSMMSLRTTCCPVRAL